MNSSKTTFRTESKNGVGLITLGGEDAHVYLTLNIIRQIDLALREWEVDNAIRMVVLRSTGSVFCAGADMNDLYEAICRGEGRDPLTRDYFRENYIMNYRIFQFSKPFVSLINAPLLGDGLGLALYGSHRIVTERVRLAVPETEIGFIPDAGATYFLSRFPGVIGRYIGLTGAHMHATDAVYVGLATHYITAERLHQLEENLLAGGFTDKVQQELEEIIAPYKQVPEESPLKRGQAEINRCFNHSHLEDIMYHLAEGASDWHRQTLGALKAASPTALKATLRLLKAGRRLSFEEALQLEYRVSQYILTHPDFREGIRAHIVERDHQPHWYPDVPEAVSTPSIDRFFEPLPEGELRLRLVIED